MKCSCDRIHQPLLFFTLISFYYRAWCGLFYWYHFTSVIEHFLPWYHFTTVMWIFKPSYHFTTVMWPFLPWYHFTSVMEHFLPWYHFFQPRPRLCRWGAPPPRPGKSALRTRLHFTTVFKVTRPSFLGGYHPTLKLSGIPTFTFIVSLTHKMDNI